MLKLREHVISEPILDLTALKAVDDSLADNGVLINVINLGVYKLDKISTKTPDDNHYVETNSGTGRWIKLSTNYTGTPTITLGGITAGTLYTEEPNDLMWKNALEPYQNPAFTSFGISGISTLEVGYSITGLKTFTWATSNSGNVKLNSIYIYDVTYPGGLTLLSALANDGSEQYDFSTMPGGKVQLILPGAYTWKINGTNTLENGFTRNFAANWYWKLYYGTSTNSTLNQTEIKGLASSLLTSTVARTYGFAAGGYKYICVQEGLPQPTTFKDASTNLDVPFEAPFNVSVDNVYSITTNYKVYRSTNILGAAINIIVS